MSKRAMLALGLLATATSVQLQAVHAQSRPPVRGGAPSPEQCASVTAVARYEAYGYTHVVELKNGCDRPVTCEVWTDVDAAPHHTLKAKPGESASVMTRRGSPAREFKAEKQCKF